MTSLTRVTYHLNKLIRLQISRLQAVTFVTRVPDWWHPLGASVDRCLGGSMPQMGDRHHRHPESPLSLWSPLNKCCCCLWPGIYNIIKMISVISNRGILEISWRKLGREYHVTIYMDIINILFENCSEKPNIITLLWISKLLIGHLEYNAFLVNKY